MKRILIASLFILLLSHEVTCGYVILDMMPNAFDDQYLGCGSKMDKEAPKLLQKEKSDPQFNKSWEVAKDKWKTKAKYVNITGFKEEYGIAVVLYTMHTPIYSSLNNNVRTAGKSTDYYMKSFHFKALHFYLTRALQLLTRGCKQRLTTYRGTRVAFNVSAEMRFGQFASSSRNKTKAQRFGNETLFTITSCWGADIQKLSEFPGEEEVLIPVFEKFQRVAQRGKLVTLRTTGKRCSYFNCAYIRRAEEE
uniref:NAD(P)(+)--arginine ADP-ribosyltransferase n=1 Tax=Leptobrachium leishanense TaxID=445787 RepID=A0A8C5M8R8_9ANUR